MAGQTAAPLCAPAAALGEGSTGAGGAGVPAHRAVAGHLARGVHTTGDNGAGVPALVAKYILHRIFSGLYTCPADMLIPFEGMNGQDFCLDLTGMAALKAGTWSCMQPNKAHHSKVNQVGKAIQALGITC